MYRGLADWGAISHAAGLARGTETLILGNGDLGSMEEVFHRLRETGVDGVLVGRSALGNPWFFRNKLDVKQALKVNCPDLIRPYSVELEDRFKVLKEHARHHEATRGLWRFVGMRKHMGWYCKGFYKASELRVKLFQTQNAQEVEEMIDRFNTTILGGRFCQPSFSLSEKIS